jgi:hypothetical protein
MGQSIFETRTGVIFLSYYIDHICRNALCAIPTSILNSKDKLSGSRFNAE